MNLHDLLKRVTEEDGRKVFIYKDFDGGWCNVNFEVNDSAIVITPDISNSPFSSDK